jgi:zinc/manganese transport system permease protein
MVHWIFEAGFFSSAPVHTALCVGILAAITSGLIGVFVLLRRQAFAGHALSDVATAGGSGAFLAGVSSLAGFVAASLLGAGAISLVGDRRVRTRDLATGIVLGAATGVSALLLYFASTRASGSSSTQQILFGSVFSLSPSLIPIATLLTVAAAVGLAWCRGPLLLHSISEELAQTRGVNSRRLSVSFLVLLALAVALSSVVLGSILATALLVGPPAAALRLSTRLASTVVYSCVFGVGATSIGILLSYDSYYWSSSHRSLPVSFFVVVTVLLIFIVSSGVGRRRSLRADSRVR